MTVLLESTLREAAARLHSMPSLCPTPNATMWLKDYDAHLFDYDSDTRPAPRTPHPLGDQQPSREAPLLLNKMILEKLWSSVEDSWLVECSHPQTGLRVAPKAYARSRLINLTWETVHKMKTEYHSQGNAGQGGRDFKIFGAQACRMELQPASAAVARDAPPPRPLAVSEGEYERARKEATTDSSWLPTPPLVLSQPRLFWYEQPYPGLNSAVLQYTSLDEDDREQTDEWAFVPRAGGGGASDDAPYMPTYTSSPVLEEKIPPAALRGATATLDAVWRLQLILRSTTLRMSAAYASLARAWYALAPALALAPIREPITCTSQTATEECLTALLRNAVRDVAKTAVLEASILLDDEPEDKSKKGGAKSKKGGAKPTAPGGGGAVRLPPSERRRQRRRVREILRGTQRRVLVQRPSRLHRPPHFPRRQTGKRGGAGGSAALLRARRREGLSTAAWVGQRRRQRHRLLHRRHRRHVWAREIRPKQGQRRVKRARALVDGQREVAVVARRLRRRPCGRQRQKKMLQTMRMAGGCLWVRGQSRRTSLCP